VFLKKRGFQKKGRSRGRRKEGFWFVLLWMDGWMDVVVTRWLEERDRMFFVYTRQDLSRIHFDRRGFARIGWIAE
jgi:hypothetical protein